MFSQLKVEMERKWAEKDILGMQEVFRNGFLSEITKKSNTFSKVIKSEIVRGIED